MTVIIKLGGSLLATGRELVQFLSDYAIKNELSLIIIPGGGPFVKIIKRLSEEMAISDDAAHWMAVLAMHQYGFFLADGEITIPVVESIDAEVDTDVEEECSGNTGRICIVLPYKILKADDSLPHTWDVTSDTIAAFIADKLGEKSFIKLTDVDGILDEDEDEDGCECENGNVNLIEEIHAKELIDKGITGCIDAELPRFLLLHNMSCLIVNGNVPERIIDVINGRETETVCTRVISN